MRDLLKDYRVFDIDLYKLRSKNFHRDMIADRATFLQKLSHCLKPDAQFRCPLCGATDKKLYLAYEGYKLFECLRCSAVAPNLDLEALEKFNFHSSELMQEDLKREILATFEYRKQTFATERVKYLKEIIPGFGSPKENVLDVGCGAGYFLSHLRDLGIKNRGLEINPTCVSFCGDLGLDVSATRVEDEPPESYSLITMFDVLEHISNPVEFMTAVGKKLRPGGYLLAYTPNLHSMSTRLMEGKHNMLAVFNHLCFFDEKSLRFLAEKSGLALPRVDYYGLDLLDYLAMKESDDNVDYFRRLREIVGPLQALLDANRLSNCMRVLFRRPEA